MKNTIVGFILVLCAFAFTGCPGDLLLSPPASLASDVVGPVPGEMRPVASPTFTPAGGLATSYRGSQTVSIQQSDPEDIRKIYYTIDGSTPTAQSPEYTGPITFEGNNETFTIKAIAVATDNRWIDSAVAETSIVIAPYRIYAGTKTGLYASVDNGTTWSMIMGSSISSIAASGDKVYAGTGTSGLYIYDFNTDSSTQYSTANGLPNNRVWQVRVYENTIYVSTLGGGLAISNDGGNSWSVLNNTDHLPSNYVLCAYPSGNLLYVGTTAGIAVFENNVFKKILAPGTSNAMYISFILTFGSKLFAGTFGGVFEYDGSTWNNVLNNNHFFEGFHGDGDMLLAVTGNDQYISIDGGNSWGELLTMGSGSANSSGGCFVAGKYLYIGTLGGLAVSNNYGDGGSWTRHLSEYEIKDVYAAP